ncbi:hypothetical protein [Neobacillus thermocopriae]|uniref:Uncharacterized protein n=1 Tax=Neobacillus thermocopriae TaxID=1215031 RepID=A0A6B3TNT0_9BACI|nr:hypothetical protein [Neobacillus thermocopriae]MED3622851.1 hypothetical protein [Neobacillus thermocopriae]MED3714691.1 hypothetical protein [Neobacillus thermocopriae]NEX77437.1 hypothetical protein [Neobacillus thermocopriae]
MNYFIRFVLAILLTSLSYFLGSHLMNHALSLFQAFIIGISVVSLGSITEAIGAPIWLIVALPFPIGMTLLYLFLDQPFLTWLFTYLIILGLYCIIHMIMSYFFKFHSLIPAWKLSK